MSNISSLIVDYSLLNSFIESNKFDSSLQLYSILTNISNDNQNKISLKHLLKEIHEEYSDLLLNQFQEFIQIFQNLNIRLLIDSYDFILLNLHLTKSFNI